MTLPAWYRDDDPVCDCDNGADFVTRYEYLDGAGLANDPKAVLFQNYSRATGQLTGNPVPPANACEMIQRRAKSRRHHDARRQPHLSGDGRHCSKNCGTLEKAAQMANHASGRSPS